LNDGTRHRRNTCTGCQHEFPRGQLPHHLCEFETTGFPWDDSPRSQWAQPCGVKYHAQCIRAGAPFQTRLPNHQGLVYPWQAPAPHYVCELCVVRAHLNRELYRTGPDVSLILVERVRQIDFMSGWSTNTLKKYGPLLRYLNRFRLQFGVEVLKPTPLRRPPTSPAIPLCWAELVYSLRSSKGRDGDMHRIKYSTVRQIRSATAWYHTLDMAMSLPGQVMRDRFRRGMVMPYVSPTDESTMSFAHSGMARRMGTETQKSWALSHVHIAYMDSELHRMFATCTDPGVRHELACAGLTNLLAYLAWLRGGEIFSASPDDLTIILPEDGPTRGLPPGVGALEYSLLTATKSDPTLAADIIVAYTTLTGLSPGTWAHRLKSFTPARDGLLFSTALTPTWTSRHFRENFAIPLLEIQRLSGEPTLQSFSAQPGHRIQDKVYSIHSWRRGGRSKVSRSPRHNEPKPTGARKATPDEVYEHGRWENSQAGENMPRRYNQWDLADRIGLTLFCM
jgi:hypothetical protein